MLERIYAELDSSRGVLNLLLLEVVKKNKKHIKETEDGIRISMRYIPIEIKNLLTKIGYLIKRNVPGTNLEMYTDMEYLYIYVN